ncbi:MAG: response regulator transcription factor [Planctomycetota bacterium]|jgi:FixJ family two-component response regulator
MDTGSKEHVFVIDDDQDILTVVSLILKRAKYECTCFARAYDVVQQLQTNQCDLLIVDVRMPGKSGMKLLKEVKRFAPWLPVIMMTGYAEIRMAVQAVKAGAFDFIEKPVDSRTLLAAVRSALKQHDGSKSFASESLTTTEKTILNLILHGKSNKEIARILHRSTRTVEYHRNHIMHKLSVHNLADLVKRAMAVVPESRN